MLEKKVLLAVCLIITISAGNCSSNENGNNRMAPIPSSNGNAPASSPAPTATFSRPISITSPVENEQVIELPIVEGTVSDSAAKVWVIVHPMEVSDYWVQQAVTMKEGGKWKVQIHIGRSGNVDVGKHFEIVAVANPKSSLKEGDRLTEWPEAQWKSQVIEVLRK